MNQSGWYQNEEGDTFHVSGQDMDDNTIEMLGKMAAAARKMVEADPDTFNAEQLRQHNEMLDQIEAEREEQNYFEENYYGDKDDYDPEEDTFTYEVVTLEQSRKGQAYVQHIHMESREDGTDEWENYRWKQKLNELPDHHRAVCVALAKAGKWGEELTEHFGRADDAVFDRNEFRHNSIDEIPF